MHCTCDVCKCVYSQNIHSKSSVYVYINIPWLGPVDCGVIVGRKQWVLMFFVSTVTCLRHKTVQAYLTNKDISEFEVSPEHVWEKLPYGDTGLFDALRGITLRNGSRFLAHPMNE